MKKTKRKVWDVVQPRDNWERGFAKLAYEHEGLRQVFTKRIIVRSCATWQKKSH
jgi:hypothetical protein